MKRHIEISKKQSIIKQQIIVCPSCKNSYKVTFSDYLKYKTCSTSCLLKYLKIKN